ncbi:JA-methyltransferase [Heracleum sosnowskyi]|uniref:JA-methyltransferase n=1 Tax=Heracleum sosnowskyi TaxID=360622 RepID=A0AAD8GU40_9APIA|nr:JA-methyltransferase [Heracleum sosnowskyi]
MNAGNSEFSYANCSILQKNVMLKSKKVLEDTIENYGTHGSGWFFLHETFPAKSLHFVHSSSGVHWLSQVPEDLLDYNKENIHMANSSPSSVYEAYFTQFKKDFTTFLRIRSEEILPIGRMVLTLLGRSNADPTIKDCCYIYGLLGKSLVDMSAQGLLHEEDITSFNLPLYAP